MSFRSIIQDIIVNLKIKVNGKFISINHNEEDNSFNAEISSDIQDIEIQLGNKLLAQYKINQDKPTLISENLIDTYFIKNSILNKYANFQDIVETTHSIKTDLHTHYAGAPTAISLINLGLDKDLKYPTDLLRKAGIILDTEEKTISLKSLSKPELQILENAMQISVGEQIRFSNDNENLEKIYSFRQPFFRDYSLTSDLLEIIAKEYAQNGVSYVELSGSQIFDLDKEPQMLKIATEKIPELEEKYGVKLRFLGAMTRYDDVEWSLDQLEKIKLVANNPYIVGIDVVGHETNSTLDIVNNIEPYMLFAKENNLDWTFRFHAGENPSHPENVKEALKLAEKHAVNIRIGHGLYGIDKETLSLAKRTNAIIEINSSSNLSLNNVTDIEEMQPLVFYLKNGINIVLGTDSPGIYQTTSPQELAVAQRILQRNGLSSDLIDKILTTEETVLNRRHQEEVRLSSIKNSTVIPPVSKFLSLFKHWSPAVEVKKTKERKEKFNSKIDKIKKLGGKYIEAEQIKKYFTEQKKIPFVISGASKSNWKQLSEEEKEKIKQEMINLLDNLNPNKYILVTGGTDYGVEEIIHNYARSKGFSVLGVLTEEASLTEIKNHNISHYTIADGNWWAKSSFVMDNIIKPCEGKVLFVAGGPIVGDEILSSIYHKLDTTQLFLLTGVGGSSDKKAKQNPEFAVNSASDIINTIKEQNKSELLMKIFSLRKKNPEQKLVKMRLTS